MFAHGRIPTLLKSLTATRRRGTILLLVLGALAMVLILTVVYAALGKGDRTTGRSVNLNRDAGEVADRLGVYTAGIIAADVFDVVPEFAEQRLLDLDPSLRARYRLETIDAPTSDFSKRSILDEAQDPILAGLTDDELALLRFDATGAHQTRSVWPDAGALWTLFPVDPRIAADPYLASTRPTDLGEGSKDTGLIGGPYDSAPYYARAIDWLQITNIAPDGRFVNLGYLRDNFDAPSLDLTRDPETFEPRLTLFDVDGAAVEAGDGGFTLGLAAVVDYGGVDIDGGGNVTPDWNVPAHWTMYQRNMARTIAELSREGFDTNAPNDPKYWEYSYADADGDGIIDSRWFELVDASSGFEVPLLGETDRRYFAAARIIDLSSLINVNTATDPVSPPSLASRAGQGPHETSLFTLLTLDMHGQAMTGIGANVQQFGGLANEPSYEAFFQARAGDERNDYEDVTSEELVRQGRKAYLRLRRSIEDWEAVAYGEVPTVFRTQEDPDADWSPNLWNYTPYTTTDLSLDAADRRRTDYANFGSVVPGFAGGGTARTGPFGLTDLIELLTFHGANDPQTFTALEKAFTADNTDADLRTRSLLRSDRTLLAEIGVELDDTANPTGVSPGVLNRRGRAHLDVRSLLTTISGARPIRSTTADAGGIVSLGNAQRRLRADELMLGSWAYEGEPGGLSTRNNATLIAQNNARNPLIENGFAIYLQTLAPHLAEFTDGAAWPTAVGPVTVADRARTLFYGHSGPEIALRMAAHMAVNFRDAADRPFVDVSPADGVPDAGTAEDYITDVTDSTRYAERRDEPSRALLWLASQEERDAGNLEDAIRPLVKPNPADSSPITDADIAVLDADEILAVDSDGNGDIEDDESLLATGTVDPASAEAMIVYGVEAQPFLSEVFYFNAYWDAPRAPVVEGSDTQAWTAGVANRDDSDYLVDNPTNGEYLTDQFADQFDVITRPEEAIRGMVNINGEVDEGNRDFLFQVVAFQLFNPFDVPVALNDFYIEFGGSLYRPEAPSGAADSLVMQPGETRLLYATNPGVDLSAGARTRHDPIADRLSQVIDQAGTLNSVFRNKPSPFGAQLPSAVAAGIIGNLVPDNPDPTIAPRVPLRRYDVLGDSEITGFEDLLAGDPTDYGQPDARNQTVLLWRDLGDRFGSVGAPDWRRDDLLADRLTETTPAGDPPALDQRLRLAPSDAITSTSLIPYNGFYRVNNAFTGADINNPAAPVAYKEGQTFSGARNLNDDGERSVGLWARVRRYDSSVDIDMMTGDDYGSGGRSANGLPGPSGDLPTPSLVEAPGSNAADGDQSIAGVPAGAMPAGVFETSQNVVRSAQEALPGAAMTGDELHFSRSFGYGRGALTVTSYETALTIEEFIQTKLLDPSELQENRLLSLRSDFGVMSPNRYQFTGANPGPIYYEAIDAAGLPRATPYSGDRMIQIGHNSNEFRTSIDGFPQLRVGDLLNVLAVGPYRMPLRTPSPGPDGYPTDPDQRVQAYLDQWTTLSEVLGVAEQTLTELEDPASGFEDAFDQLAGMLDRGHLRLDEFVPYFDFDGDDTQPFNPNEDRVRGLGIPLAMGIFDLVQAGGDLPGRAYGTISSPVAGLVNINTAPPSVLRTLPGLYQDIAVNDLTRDSWPAWAGRLEDEADPLQVGRANALISGSSFVDAADPSGTGGDERVDIASSLLSYREASAGYNRLLWTDRLFAGSTEDVPLNMQPNAVRVDPTNPTSAFDLTRGVEILRFGNEGPAIAGLRTAPGFGSIGELLAVRPSGTATDRFDGQRFQYGMDWVARDRRTIGQLFLDPVTTDPAAGEPTYTDAAAVENFVFRDGDDDLRIVTLDPTPLGDPLRFRNGSDTAFQLPTTDQIPDDYDEQLVQINMLANSVSTSSDFYAAWMVIHGFDEDDVTGLQDDEPMRPSFRRRYLMVVDRSNVVERGDQPRVLAFLEVPYDEQVRNPIYAPE